MTEPFRSFVIFAEMRTGSNLLEATLNGLRGVTCFGEAFNPYMMGWPDKDELEGVTRAEREADPMALLKRLIDKPGHMSGFRYFHDHDPRVFDAIMNDASCAKIILTRNPLDSYVSTRLAWETNQWKLNETETPIPASITYDGPEFRQMLDAVERFQARVLHRLQVSGQTGFWLGYEDLRDADVMTGLAHWMGRTDVGRIGTGPRPGPAEPARTGRQGAEFRPDAAGPAAGRSLHPAPHPEFRTAPRPVGAQLCRRRGRAGADLYAGALRVRGLIRDWMARLGEVQQDFTQSSLRQWKRKHPGTAALPSCAIRCIALGTPSGRS